MESSLRWAIDRVTLSKVSKSVTIFWQRAMLLNRSHRAEGRSFDFRHCVVPPNSFGMFLALNKGDVKRCNMKAQTESNDPGRILAHASLYLWRYWRQYALTAWEDAECILRRAYDAVEEEDRIEFTHALELFAEQSSISNAEPGTSLVALEQAAC